jgi:hypothetical protein
VFGSSTQGEGELGVYLAISSQTRRADCRQQAFGGDAQYPR